MRILLLAVAAPALVWGQIRLSLIEGGAERAVAEVTDLGVTDASDALDARFRARNSAATAISLHTLSVAGAGFALASAPGLPANLAAGASVDFIVRLTPAGPGVYSAVLTVNAASVLLRARAVAGLVVSHEDNRGRTRLSAGDKVDFGQAEVGVRVVRRFVLENPHREPLALDRFSVEGSGFSLADGARLPQRFEPGQEFAFHVTFAPDSPGPQTGRLIVNGRGFVLAGVGIAPPLPRPRIVLDPAAPGSGRQVRVRIRLAEPARTAGEGELRLQFEPAAPGWPDDPGIAFLSPAGRIARFSVEARASAATFGGRDEIVMQTGTTAGRLTLTARLGEHVEQASLVLAPLPVQVDSARLSRGANGVELALAGFDNTRSVSRIVFTFYGADGRLLEPGPIAVDLAAEFRRYFESSALGGMFALRAVFPVMGDAGAVAGVEVELANSVAATRTSRIGF